MFQLADCTVESFIIRSDEKSGTLLLVETSDSRKLIIHGEKCLEKHDYEYLLRVVDQSNEDDPESWEEIVDRIKTMYGERYDVYVFS